MIKKLFILKLILFNIYCFSQVLTYVGNSALVTIQSQTLLYNGGGLQTAGTSIVNNSGNVMLSASSTNDMMSIANTSNFNLRLASTSDYGQLYITGIPQDNITGKVNKEYLSDYVNGATGRQQIGLPFHNFTIPELVAVFGEGNLNVTNTTNNSSGRFNVSSAFWWNNARARFDQIAYGWNGAYDAAGTPTPAFISPLTYYILPRRKADESVFWNPTSDKRTFTGTPVSDNTLSNVQITLGGGYSSGFGVNGSGTNYFGERYYSYIDDPFRSKTPNWESDYGINLYHLANPFLTNVDLKFIGTSEATGITDDNNINNLVGVAYYGNSQVNWDITQGARYGTAIVALADEFGNFQSGDISTNRLLIKPMGAFMVKLRSNASQTLNLSKTRRFKYTSRGNSTNYSVSAAKMGEGSIPADKIVKQVAVVMYDADGLELDRTYYAVSPTAVTGRNTITNRQSYSQDKKIYTKEEATTGGEDYNYSDKLYINEANQLNYKSKEIPLYIDYSEKPYQVKFELYEAGERVENGLSSGAFYLKNTTNEFIKIADGESLSMNGSQHLGLYYELPDGATLGTGNVLKSQTIIGKKDEQWVVRFAKDWNKATVEVYSAAGQLLNSKSQIPTSSDYSIPMNYQVKGVFLVKAISEKGEVVIKKIVN